MGICKRHLNWTWILVWFATSIGLNIGVGLSGNYIVVLVIVGIGYYGTTLWVLSEKGRSLAWCLFPISALFLTNKRRLENEET